MGDTKKFGRGIPPWNLNFWTDTYEKEARLRLKWFRKNEDRLVAYSEKPFSKTVPPEILNKIAEDRKEQYQKVEKHPRPHSSDPPPPLVDPRAIFNVMKPVDPVTERLIYTGANKDGRLNYLHERVKIIPEDKYYFPETSSFRYGWNMWHSSTTATPVRYGRCQVIRASFYRRNGVGRDPDWYQKPQTLSSTICDRT
ncbi:hypothetical protein FQR65_LT03368 [Abscondita terminalis]|nr:hypothetical protein FQR65_LT17880 [Abscondita terminalis]KAF5279546.1 hypothetical protein FQR65_LT03368 [Abscondita terminalis]